MKNTHLAILLMSVLVSTSAFAQRSDNLTVREIGNSPDPDDNKNVRNFRFTVGGGYACRLGKTYKTGDSRLDDFSSKLRNGYVLDAEIQYFLHENWGLGLNMNFARQSAKESGTMYVPGQGSIKGLKETQTCVYVGPGVVTRFENKKFGLYLGAGFGPIFNTNEDDVEDPAGKIRINKVAFGSYLGVAGEYRLSPMLGIGLKAAITSGKVKLSDEFDNFSVSNLTVTGFISFRTK